MITNTAMDVTLTSVNTITAGSQIFFNVNNVKNPASTVPSSDFSNMYFYTSSGYYISSYTKEDVYV